MMQEKIPRKTTSQAFSRKLPRIRKEKVRKRRDKRWSTNG
jgi:hypothetical protein